MTQILRIRSVKASSERLWLIVALAAALRLFPIWFGLSYPQARPDEAVAITHAMDVLAGDFNPRFFHWPSFIFYAFAALFGAASLLRRILFLGAELDPITALLFARGLIAVAGTTTVLVVFLLARRMADATTGLLAALFLAVAILHVRDSHFAMTDVMMTLLVTTSLAMVLRALDRALEAQRFDAIRLMDFAIAGLVGGLAASTKYNAGAIVASMGAAQIVLWARLSARPWWFRTWLPSLVFVIAFIGGFLGATPYAVLDHERFAADLLYDFTHLSTGHGINLGRGWLYHLTRSLPYGSGVLTFAAALAAVPIVLRRYRHQTFVIGAFAVAFYAAIGSGYTVFFRYVLPLIPIICLFAAVTVRHASFWLAVRADISSAAAIAVLTMIVGAPALVNCIWFDGLLARADTRVLAAQWLAPRLHAGESVHDSGGDFTRLELGSADFDYWSFDPASRSFGHPDGLTPHWLILAQSPLRTYANAPAPLRRLADERYDLVFMVRGTKGSAASAVYDLQDAFFMPLNRFDTVERPGPTMLIYRRRDAPLESR